MEALRSLLAAGASHVLGTFGPTSPYGAPAMVGALMFALGCGTLAIAMTGDMKLWAFYVSFVLLGAKLAAFAIQYVAFRILVTGRIRAARA